MTIFAFCLAKEGRGKRQVKAGYTIYPVHGVRHLGLIAAIVSVDLKFTSRHFPEDKARGQTRFTFPRGGIVLISGFSLGVKL